MEKGHHQSGYDTCAGRLWLCVRSGPPNERVLMNPTADITTGLTSAMGFFIFFFILFYYFFLSSADKAEVL